MNTVDMSFEVKPFAKQMFKGSLPYMLGLVLYIGYQFFKDKIDITLFAIAFFACILIFVIVAFDNKYQLVLVKGDGRVLHIAYYKYGRLITVETDWESFAFKLLKSTPKYGDDSPYMEFKDNGVLMGKFYFKSKEEALELSRQLNAAKPVSI
jgi:hypothetical protein